jgi:predicted nucleic-acid-binding protein
MKTVAEYALDANIILRYLMQDDVDLYASAQRIFEAIDVGEIIALLDPVNLAEVVWVMQSFYQLSPADIGPVLETLLNSPFIDIAYKEQYLTALRLYAGGLHHFGDACACAAAMDRCDGRMLSFDRKLSRVSGIRRYEQI